MRGQPLIIGAGPAGTAAAIHLAQAGHRPLLLDRATGPSDKVCGDFLGADAIDRLRVLGIDPASLGAAVIHVVRFSHGRRITETRLPFPAFSLSRRILDQALLSRAIQAGADVHQGTIVRRISPLGTAAAGIWHAHLHGGETKAGGALFLATGKHDLRDLPRPGTRHGAVGLKMYLDLGPAQSQALAGATELFLFPGGYAGLQPVEAGKAVLCIALHRSRFQALAATWPTLLAHLQSSTLLGERLAAATPLLPKPLAIAGVPYGFLHPETAAPAGLFRVGDQAAVIPSLTGDGIAIALHTGALAAEAWLTGRSAAAYHRQLRRDISGQMRLALVLHRLAMAGPLQAASVRLATWFPSLLRHAATRTRIRRPIPAAITVPTTGLHPA